MTEEQPECRRKKNVCEGKTEMKPGNYSRPLDLKKVQITDEFWGREQELVRRRVLPYQWDALNDRIPDAAPSYCMRNFRVAGRLMREKREQGKAFVAPVYTFRGFEALPEDPAHPEEDKFYGFVFQDSDFAKWIEAVGYSLMNHPDAELEKTADGAIDIVCAAQAENGYLDTYYIINGMDRIFTNLRDHHELYCFGHLVEGAISYYQATGKDKLLKAAMRYADFIAEHFGPEEGKCKGYPGHEIAEMALARLYELTGEEKYLALGCFFLDRRGTKPYYFDLEDEERAAYEGRTYRAPDASELRYQYHQAHLPVREQSEAVGHAVRAVYLYSGMADMARLTGDEAMRAACERLWSSIVNQKLYITGGIGGTHLGEAFSFPYDLPNDTAYSETCAAIGLAFFARRMLELEPDNSYGDVLEQALYNTVLAGMSLDGRSFFYVNPLEVLPEACRSDERKRHVKPVRQKWFGCACCPPNIARTVSSLGAYVYTGSGTTLFTHLYVGSTAGCTLNGKQLRWQMESGFPWDGNVRMQLHAQEAVEGTLAFRVPGWCREATLEVWKEGRPAVRCAAENFHAQGACGVRLALEKGYFYVTGSWQEGDEIRLSFPMRVRCVTAGYRVRECTGKVAFVRGPICYCMEEADNGRNLQLLKVDREKLCGVRGELSGVRVEKSEELGHEMCILKVPGKRREIPHTGGEALYSDYVPETEGDVTLTLIPYYAWSNRGEGEMSVWLY